MHCIVQTIIWMKLLRAAAVLVKVEIEVIDKLDEMISDGQGDDEYKELFTTTYVLTLLNTFQKNNGCHQSL